MTSFQQAPPERLIDDPALDPLKSLRALRDRYIATYERTNRSYYLVAASRISVLVEEPLCQS